MLEGCQVQDDWSIGLRYILPYVWRLIIYPCELNKLCRRHNGEALPHLKMHLKYIFMSEGLTWCS